MDIKYNIGDTITIPEGCKATIKDNQIIIEKSEFKFGDILISKNNRTVIFSNYTVDSKALFCNYYDGINNRFGDYITENFRLATEEEKQVFFNKLKAYGLYWNTKELRLEIFRARVELGDEYLCIDSCGNVLKIPDYYTKQDDERFNLGNYYLLDSPEYAERDAAAIRAIFERRIKL